SVDQVFHSASAVNFIQPYSYMKRDNVEGLGQVLRFCASGRCKPLMLLSSISVYSWGHLHTGKRLMREDDDIDQNLPAVVTDMGYVRSKWVMEKIADLAAERGLPLMTFRLGYATCHSRTGAHADYQWWSRLARTCLEYRAVPLLRELREGLTTVDYMVEAISVIARQPSALGKKFNLVPSIPRCLTLDEFFGRLGRRAGRPLRQMPFDDWVSLWEDNRDAPLYPLLSMFRDNMYAGRSTVELYQDTYLWDCTNVEEHLRGSAVREPEFDDRLLDLYLAGLGGSAMR
ncbi:thioester reductase domain-containing protein, partial [Pseudomonas aeruginosa]